ncbi:alkaline phosphatase D family protein [Actinopolymorpha alba]|uniref:alkaline phosphatase D family protein n=1 Tax=Actinopolymorpha alba TaxID=533267 RepID=UPI000363785E|nr:alkaline phosphatase D family protein [Actinopolymorpha alba]
MTPLSRRRLLTVGSLSAGALLTGSVPPISFADATFGTTDPARTTSRVSRGLPADVFQLGVASGEPWPDSVVLWTRLAPDPLHGGGLRGIDAVPVEWEIARDQAFRFVERRGTAYAHPREGHSVHVEPQGLRPGREYYYRFRAGTQISPVGRTRTAPARHAQPHRMRFAFASCQNYQHGYFVAYRDLVEQDVEFLAFLGDYIYESAPHPRAVRRHEGTGEPVTLAEYRNRYARYKTDPDLRAAHAHCPWIVTFDDHEVDNDWAGGVPQDPGKQSPAAFAARRAAAYQAWYEHMPVRRIAKPQGTRIQAYRRLRWGDLARIHVLDTRQYRTDQARDPRQFDDPSRTMTGPAQERWLVDGLTSGGQRWNLLANQVPLVRTDRKAGPEEVLWADPWDGYRAQRRRLLRVLGSDPVSNPVVLTGDRHFTMACDLTSDFDDPGARAVGAEIVGTSITSEGDQDQAAWHRRWDQVIAESPYWKYGDGRRGYVVCDVDRERALATLRVASNVGTPDGRMSTARQFVIESGRRGLEAV